MAFNGDTTDEEKLSMYKTLDLFAGAGGLSLGFQQTGKFQIVAAAEINKNAQETFRKNIFKGINNFEFIDNVRECNFKELSNRLGGIEIVIGGPPCQGFSNANRQKNHLISSNNALVKEYFRAIKEIKPLAFVMENVNMLRSNVHRFYDSEFDNEEINKLLSEGFEIPKRLDSILISNALDDIDILSVANCIENVNELKLPERLYQLLAVLCKNMSYKGKLDNYLEKQGRAIRKQIEFYKESLIAPTRGQNNIVQKLSRLHEAIEKKNLEQIQEELLNLFKLQKVLRAITEIYENKLMGRFITNDKNDLMYEVNSYSVIDYVNAILGDEYSQKGGTLGAEWFGVPQERRRYIVIGIRKDIIKGGKVIVPEEPSEYNIVTVGEAIMDLCDYTVGYEKEYDAIEYKKAGEISEYATLMRRGSENIKNHIATKTTPIAMARFKEIEQGKNFHSLSKEMKATYSKPERTQNTIYLRLNPEAPSGTVVNVRKSMWIHPTLDRAITVREAARLQSFPDEFEFVGSKDSQYQQIGNAVPPLMAEGIAKCLLSQLSINEQKK